MSRKAVHSEISRSTNNDQPRVYVTSLRNIATSSPGKTSWSSSLPSSPPSPVRKALIRFLWPSQNDPSTDDEPIISDSISESILDSKRLQNSIMVLTEGKGGDEQHEVHCCKQSEADEVIHALQKKSETQIHEGKLQEALHCLNSALALERKLHGKKSAGAAVALNRMGEILSEMGEDYRYMAMSALEESLAIRQESEPGSEDTATTLKNLWLLFHEFTEQGRTNDVPLMPPPLPLF